LGLVVAFFTLTNQDKRTLLQFMLSAIALAVANQVGNAGFFVLAFALVAGGIGYAITIVRQR
jgi:hypothetical protein